METDDWSFGEILITKGLSLSLSLTKIADLPPGELTFIAVVGSSGLYPAWIEVFVYAWKYARNFLFFPFLDYQSVWEFEKIYSFLTV